MQNYKPDLSELSDFKIWNQYDETSLANYVYFNMKSPDLLIATISLFYPSFVLVADCVIVDWKFNRETFEDWKKALKEDMRGVEFKMNYRLVSDFFNDATRELNYQNISFI